MKSVRAVRNGAVLAAPLACVISAASCSKTAPPSAELARILPHGEARIEPMDTAGGSVPTLRSRLTQDAGDVRIILSKITGSGSITVSEGREFSQKRSVGIGISITSTGRVPVAIVDGVRITKFIDDVGRDYAKECTGCFESNFGTERLRPTFFGPDTDMRARPREFTFEHLTRVPSLIEQIEGQSVVLVPDRIELHRVKPEVTEEFEEFLPGIGSRCVQDRIVPRQSPDQKSSSSIREVKMELRVAKGAMPTAEGEYGDVLGRVHGRFVRASVLNQTPLKVPIGWKRSTPEHDFYEASLSYSASDQDVESEFWYELYADARVHVVHFAWSNIPVTETGWQHEGAFNPRSSNQ